MELPEYKLPRLKFLLLDIWGKTKDFIFKAGTLIILFNIIIWFLLNIDLSFKFVGPNNSKNILSIIGNFISPVFYPLGFAQNNNGWKNVVAILTGITGKELIISSLNILHFNNINNFADKTPYILLQNLTHIFTIPSAISFIIFNLLNIPCIAALSVTNMELKNRKLFFLAILFWTLTAWFCSFIIFNILNIFF